MALPTNRTSFKEFVLRKLGSGVLQVNVTDDQVDDAVDVALQFWREYHYDGQIRKFYSLEITQQNMDDGFFDVPEEVQHVVRIIKGYGIGGNTSVNNYLFDAQYQLASSDLFRMNSSGLGNFVATMVNIANIGDILSVAPSFEFRRHTDKLYVNPSLDQRYAVGDKLGMEAILWLEPDDFEDIWMDRVFGNYAAALLRRQWGINLTKWNGVAMPGGITLNGDQIYALGQADIDKIESDFQVRYETPPRIFVG